MYLSLWTRFWKKSSESIVVSGRWPPNRCHMDKIYDYVVVNPWLWYFHCLNGRITRIIALWHMCLSSAFLRDWISDHFTRTHLKTVSFMIVIKIAKGHTWRTIVATHISGHYLHDNLSHSFKPFLWVKNSQRLNQSTHVSGQYSHQKFSRWLIPLLGSIEIYLSNSPHPFAPMQRVTCQYNWIGATGRFGAGSSEGAWIGLNEPQRFANRSSLCELLTLWVQPHALTMESSFLRQTPERPKNPSERVQSVLAKGENIKI
jgi:hypothetical protein